MDSWRYVMLIERGKTYNKINKAMVIKHVDFLKNWTAMASWNSAGLSRATPASRA